MPSCITLYINTKQLTENNRKLKIWIMYFIFDVFNYKEYYVLLQILQKSECYSQQNYMDEKVKFKDLL